MAPLFLLIHLERARRRGLLLRIVWGLEALLLFALWLLFRALPVEAASALGRRALRTWGPRFRKSENVRRNLALACPERSAAELDALLRETWGNYGAVLAEYPHIGRIWREGRGERVEVRGGERLEAIARSGQPVIFALAHLANWNLPALLARRYGFPLVAVESPLRNPLLARLFERTRSALGCDFVDKAHGPRELLRRLARGQSVVFLADTRIDPGVPVPLFGQDVPTTTVPARLALRTGCHLLPARVERLAGVRFRVTIEPPIRPEHADADPKQQALEMTRKLNDRYTAWIRERPEQWLCFKRRAPKQLAPAPRKPPPPPPGGAAQPLPAAAP